MTKEDTSLFTYYAAQLNHPLGDQNLIKVLVICTDCSVQGRATSRIVRVMSYDVDDLSWWVEGLVGGEVHRAVQGLSGDGGGSWHQVPVFFKVRNIVAAGETVCN
jgi:hypothetical protein